MSETDARAPTGTTITRQIHHFRFSGNGGEFFRIWIVNVLLTILTLGIYSAWATVRTKRYFYGNTSLAGDHFEYHATPMNILLGRMLAIGLLILYLLATEFVPVLALILILAFLFVFPWIVVRALRFNAAMSSWRGIRFGFDGTTGGAFVNYLVWPIVGVITFGLGMPYAWYAKSRYSVTGHRLGRTGFGFSAGGADFYLLALIVSAFTIGGLILIGTLIAGGMMGMTDFAASVAQGNGESPELPFGFVVMSTVLGILFYAMLFALVQGLTFRLVYNHVNVGPNRLLNNVGMGRFIWVALTNSLLLVLTLGLYYPWARVRMTSLLVNSLWVEAEDLDSFAASEAQDARAFGEEFGDAFDLGIGV